MSYASNSWPSADAGHSKRRCWAKFWTAADAENAHSGVGLPACGSLAPETTVVRDNTFLRSKPPASRPVEDTICVIWLNTPTTSSSTKLREDDVVDHFFLTSTHNWLLFFTNKGRVYRIKAYELPEGSRDSKGQHVANLLQFAPDESIQTVLSIPNYEVAKYLVLATRSGKVKKTPLAEYDSPRQGGLIAVRLMADENGENADELIGAALCNAEDDIMRVSVRSCMARMASACTWSMSSSPIRPVRAVSVSSEARMRAMTSSSMSRAFR